MQKFPLQTAPACTKGKARRPVNRMAGATLGDGKRDKLKTQPILDMGVISMGRCRPARRARSIKFKIRFPRRSHLRLPLFYLADKVIYSIHIMPSQIRNFGSRYSKKRTSIWWRYGTKPVKFTQFTLTVANFNGIQCTLALPLQVGRCG